jgi:hypothetical protein
MPLSTNDHQSPVAVFLGNVKEFLGENLVQLLVGAASLYLLLRLLTITDHSPSTALAFVESSGLVNTVLGLVLQLLPEALLLAAAAVTGIVLQRVLALTTASDGAGEASTVHERFVRAALYGAGTVLWALMLTTVPSPLGFDSFSSAAELIAFGALVLAIVGGAYGAVKGRSELGSLQLSWKTWKTYWALPWLAGGAALLLLGHLALDRQLWLPPELITVPASIERVGSAAGAEPAPAEDEATVAGSAAQPVAIETRGQPQDSMVGYVLKGDDRWTTVLLERPRVVVRLDSAKIINRTVCRLAPRSLPLSALKRLIGGPDQAGDDRDVTPPCQGLENDQ